VVACSPQGFLDPADVEAAVRPHTVMVVLNHGSNVVGSLLPVAEAGRICRQHGLLLLVDAAQTAGAYPIDVEADGIDLLGFTGHKALCGTMGTGGLYIGPRVDLERFEPLIRGGTGSRSEMEEQPDFLPDLCESGTANTVGLAGLGAGVRFLLEQGVENIRCHEQALTAQLIEGLKAIPSTGSGQAPSTGPSAGSGRGSGRRPGVTVYGGHDAARQTATVSFNVAGLEPSEVGLRLDEEYGILCRVGLHCAPSAHKTIGTFPTGTVRFGLGYFNTKEEVEAAVQAVREIAG